MRLGIKGKQVLGVTSIVGAVVVVLSLMHLARLAQRQPRREPGARRAAGERDLPSRARRSSADGADPLPGAARRSRPALDPRVEPLLEERHLRGDRRRRTGSRSRTPIRRSKGSRCRPAATSTQLLARSPLSQLRAIYSRPGAEPRVPPAAAARRHRVRLDPHRRLDAADPAGSRRVAAARRWSPRSSRSAWRCSARCCWRSCCCGRST